jgi:cell division protein ZapA (FtsZ GTPase activity inhibitor)
MEADAKMGDGSRGEVQLNRVKVTILGEEYTIKSDSDAKYVQRIAAKVDRELTEMGKQVPGVLRERLAVLLALNLMDKLEQRAARAARAEKKSTGVAATQKGDAAAPSSEVQVAEAGDSEDDGGLFGPSFEPNAG